MDYYIRKNFLFCCVDWDNPDFDPREHLIGEVHAFQQRFTIDGITYDPGTAHHRTTPRPMFELL